AAAHDRARRRVARLGLGHAQHQPGQDQTEHRDAAEDDGADPDRPPRQVLGLLRHALPVLYVVHVGLRYAMLWSSAGSPTGTMRRPRSQSAAKATHAPTTASSALGSA